MCRCVLLRQNVRKPTWRCQARGVLTASIEEKLDKMDVRLKDLNDKMANGLVPLEEFPTVGREISELSAVIEHAQRLRKLQEDAVECRSVISSCGKGSPDEDIEMCDLATAELEETMAAIPEVEEAIMTALLPKDETDEKNVILEVRAGTGGDESGLFTQEVFEMYQHYAAARGWRWQPLHFSKTAIGGCKEAAAQIQGHDVYSHLKFESGVHRVQRIPVNDVRIQTSAMSVVVLPEAGDIDIKIDPADLRIDVYRASGAGGQHVNTTESAVRITHIPTGIVVAIQDERSQHQNRSKAMLILKSRIYAAEREKQRMKKDEARATAQATGDRSDRIRTYNFPQDRVTDHRLGLTKTGVERMLNGDDILDDFLTELRKKAHRDAVSAMLEQKA